MFSYWYFGVLFTLFIVGAREIIFKKSFLDKEEYIITGLSLGLLLQSKYDLIFFLKILIIPAILLFGYSFIYKKNNILMMALFNGLLIIDMQVLFIFAWFYIVLLELIKHFNQKLIEAQGCIIIISLGLSLGLSAIV